MTPTRFFALERELAVAIAAFIGTEETASPREEQAPQHFDVADEQLEHRGFDHRGAVCPGGRAAHPLRARGGDHAAELFVTRGLHALRKERGAQAAREWEPPWGRTGGPAPRQLSSNFFCTGRARSRARHEGERSSPQGPHAHWERVGGGVCPPVPFLCWGAPGKGGPGGKPRRGEERHSRCSCAKRGRPAGRAGGRARPSAGLLKSDGARRSRRGAAARASGSARARTRAHVYARARRVQRRAQAPGASSSASPASCSKSSARVGPSTLTPLSQRSSRAAGCVAE